MIRKAVRFIINFKSVPKQYNAIERVKRDFSIFNINGMFDWLRFPLNMRISSVACYRLQTTNIASLPYNVRIAIAEL